jgi:hypothetical protein
MYAQTYFVGSYPWILIRDRTTGKVVMSDWLKWYVYDPTYAMCGYFASIRFRVQ